MMASTASSLLVAFVFVAAAAAVQGGWRALPHRWQTTSQIVNRSTDVLEFVGPCEPSHTACRMVAIQTGPASPQLEGLFDSGGRATELRFDLQDDSPGAKTRIEGTTCFVTDEDLVRSGIDPAGQESAMLQALHFIYQNCSGAASAPDAAVPTSQNISYSLLLPANFSSASQAIMGQFHGRPDPRWFRDPRTNTTRHLSTAEAFAACHDPEAGRHGHCKEGAVTGGPLAGWQYKQGGYPPLSFGYGDGYFYVYGRSDDRLFVPKADCGFNPSRDADWPDKRTCPGGVHEQVHGMWRAPFSAVPLGHWLHFRWSVEWSAYASAGGAVLRNGSVHLRILDGGPAAPAAAPAAAAIEGPDAEGEVLADVKWQGPLGRHDDGRAPFFKFGMYNPSGDVSSMSCTYKDFRQSFTVLERAE